MKFNHILWNWSFNDQEYSVDPLAPIPIGDDAGTIFWTVIDGMTEEDANQISNDHKWTEVRHQRDIKIAETDWWVLPDRTATEEQLTYRQALRDVTDTYTSPDDVVWPTKPL